MQEAVGYCHILVVMLMKAGYCHILVVVLLKVHFTLSYFYVFLKISPVRLRKEAGKKEDYQLMPLLQFCVGEVAVRIYVCKHLLCFTSIL